MPYIDSKVTVSLTEEKKDVLKTELGKIISLIPGKSEDFLMVGFDDNYSLYFKGNKLDFGAFVEVKIFGATPQASLDAVTKEICMLYSRELDISADCIYVKYEEVSTWGWNGNNF
ncbi:MAG: hypothetical protein K0S30_225 [Clostridia bacterium]|nr:hypothetical protein [Clostridia bacterium]